MDGEYYARLGRAGKRFVNFNKPLANFRQHDEALSARLRGNKNIDVCLKREIQDAECRAIKRAYGWSPLGGSQSWTCILDILASKYYKFKKQLVKLFAK